MDPVQYVNECLWPGDPVGAQYCDIIKAAPVFHWTNAQIQEAKNRALARSQETGFFPFPKKVRYV